MTDDTLATRLPDERVSNADELLAEIEALRLQVKMIPLPEYRDDPRLREIIEGQAAEIERLREGERAADAEIDRLRCAVERVEERAERLRNACATWERANNNYAEAVELKEDEIKALRNQLQRAHHALQDARIELKRLQEYYEPDPGDDVPRP